MMVDTCLHFVSLNTQGLRERNKRWRLKQWILNQNIDVLLLQETHFSEDLSVTVANEFTNWNLYHSFGSSNSRGVSILISKILDVNVIDLKSDNEGRYIFVNIEACNNTISLINIYAPNDIKSRHSFFDNICKLLIEHSLGIKIIGGDFNEINNLRDRITSTKTKFKINQSLVTLKNENNLIDIWRHLHNDKKQFTWRRKNGVDKSRIDFWLIDSNIIPLISSTDIRPAAIYSTDHLAISLKLKKPLKRGPGFWKLNNKHLENDEYCNLIISIIEQCKTLPLEDSIKWEICKYEIKEASIKYSKQHSRQKHNRLQNLNKQLQLLLLENNINETKVSELENEIKEIYDERARGAQIRSRIQHLEEGEKNTKYFLSLEKSRQNRKTITSLIVNGKRLTKVDELLEAETEFYESLYTSRSKHNNIQQYLEDTLLENTLSQEEADVCEGPITLTECTNALNGMKLNKSPGLDGLTVEFYLKFWSKISLLVFNSFLRSHQNKELSRSQKQCVFSLLFKKGDPEKLGNWRPISLLNIDYKILARVLAERLQTILPKIISLNQQGYIQK